MEPTILFIVLFVLATIVGALLGWIAFFRTNALRQEIIRLRSEIARMREQLQQRAPDQWADVSADAYLGARVAKPSEEAPQAPQPATPAASAAVQAEHTPTTTAAQERPAASAADGLRTLLSGLEQRLAGNWMIWVAGLFIALGGVFLASYAIQQQWIGPRVWVGIACAIGLGVIAASEWLRRSGIAEGPFGHALAPPITAAAGLIGVYAAIYVGVLVEPPLPPIVAMIGLVAVAAGAAALALAHGPIFVALALVGGFVAPFLIGSDDPRAWSLFLYVFAVVLVGLAVTRLVDRRWPALIALAGGTLWPLLWLAGGYAEEQAWALCLYLPALLIAACGFAWGQAETAQRVTTPGALLADAPVSILTAHLAAMSVFILIAVLAPMAGFDTLSVAALGASALICLTAAWRREGLLAMPLIAAAGVILALFLWPEETARIVTNDIRLARAIRASAPGGPDFLPACLAFMALFGVGGLVMQDRLEVKGAMAAASAATPIAILTVAFWRVTGLEQQYAWATAALLLAFANLLLVERIARSDGGVEAQPGPSSAYALAAAAAAGIAVGMALEQLWMSVGFAVVVPASALLYQRFKLRALAWAALGFAALATVRLTVLGEVFSYTVEQIGAWPIANWLLFGYGVPAAALWWSARRFERAGIARESRTVQSLDAGALLLGVALVSAQIRHFMNGGDLNADYFDRGGLLEAGLHSSVWLASALALRWRLGSTPLFVHRWIERLLIAAGLAQTVFVQLMWLNPWWGGYAWPVSGPPVFNALAIAFALPAALCAAYAVIARRQGFARIGTIAGMIGCALAFVWVTLEVRRAYHPGFLNEGVIGDAERFTYSGVWLAFAAGLLALGVWRRRPSLRYASLVLLVGVTAKVFIDVLGLDLGVLIKALSCFVLGGVLLGIFVLYQKVIPRLLGEAETGGSEPPRRPPAPEAEPKTAPG